MYKIDIFFTLYRSSQCITQFGSIVPANALGMIDEFEALQIARLGILEINVDRFLVGRYARLPGTAASRILSASVQKGTRGLVNAREQLVLTDVDQFRPGLIARCQFVDQTFVL